MACCCNTVERLRACVWRDCNWCASSQAVCMLSLHMCTHARAAGIIEPACAGRCCKRCRAQLCALNDDTTCLSLDCMNSHPLACHHESRRRAVTRKPCLSPLLTLTTGISGAHADDEEDAPSDAESLRRLVRQLRKTLSAREAQLEGQSLEQARLEDVTQQLLVRAMTPSCLPGDDGGAGYRIWARPVSSFTVLSSQCTAPLGPYWP